MNTIAQVYQAMQPQFRTHLCVELKEGSELDPVWVLTEPLIFWSKIIGQIEVPEGFNHDFASVPRLPIIYSLWGDRVHKCAVLHDYLYRIDSKPVVSCSLANQVFLEAMKAQGTAWYIRWPIYLGVALCGFFSFHRWSVFESL